MAPSGRQVAARPGFASRAMCRTTQTSPRPATGASAMTICCANCWRPSRLPSSARTLDCRLGWPSRLCLLRKLFDRSGARHHPGRGALDRSAPSRGDGRQDHDRAGAPRARPLAGAAIADTGYGSAEMLNCWCMGAWDGAVYPGLRWHLLASGFRLRPCNRYLPLSWRKDAQAAPQDLSGATPSHRRLIKDFFNTIGANVTLRIVKTRARTAALIGPILACMGCSAPKAGALTAREQEPV